MTDDPDKDTDVYEQWLDLQRQHATDFLKIYNLVKEGVTALWVAVGMLFALEIGHWTYHWLGA